MKKFLLSTSLVLFASTGAFADVGHAKMAVGMPGHTAKVDRTIDVTLLENDEGEMLIESEEMTIKQGEKIGRASCRERV